MAWRPNHALETFALSASAASSRCSSGDKLTDTRYFEAIIEFSRLPKLLHSAAPQRTFREVRSYVKVFFCHFILAQVAAEQAGSSVQPFPFPSI